MKSKQVFQVALFNQQQWKATEQSSLFHLSPHPRKQAINIED